MSQRTYFFFFCGTGGHIYPGLAIAEKTVELYSKAKVHFFCSDRNIDSQILDRSRFKYTRLPVTGFSLQPNKLFRFCTSFWKSYRAAKDILANNRFAILVGIGGFASAPAVLAAHKLKIPIALLNVDIVPGRANKLLARFAKEIFVQFDDTCRYFAKSKSKISVTGCPLRSRFNKPDADAAKKTLSLDENKRTLVVTGASSGAKSINDAVCAILPTLNNFADQWQIVHLAGRRHFEQVRRQYKTAKIKTKVLDYYEEMADLLAAADLVVARSGAVSIAEIAAISVPSICIPYPHHRDRHQYLNAGKLVEAGAAVIVDDLPDLTDRSQWLAEELTELMADEKKRELMKRGCEKIAKLNAAVDIAQKLMNLAHFS